MVHRREINAAASPKSLIVKATARIKDQVKII